jgi:hypothetical protein
MLNKTSLSLLFRVLLVAQFIPHGIYLLLGNASWAEPSVGVSAVVAGTGLFLAILTLVMCVHNWRRRILLTVKHVDSWEYPLDEAISGSQRWQLGVQDFLARAVAISAVELAIGDPPVNLLASPR